jgi:membrane-bound lytic murein transglycosylase D
MMPAMQILLDRSKILILTLLLSWGFWLAWTSDYNGLTDNSTDSIQATRNKHVDSIWTSMGRELNLDHRTQSSQVKAEIRKLLADQDKLYKVLKAAGPYIYFIYNQTNRRGLPAELALIPVIESEFNPNDHSNKGATGLWQLMPGTAHDLGVNVKANYDGRRNVVASTKAALAYFNDLGNLFKGNWLLAIAAYNCGQNLVASAERRTGSHSFWNLPLPKETQYYVPKLLAVAAIIKNPEKYGVQLPPINNEPYFAELKVKKSVNLASVAKSSGISIDTLHTLNPDHKHEIVPTNKGSTTLLVPVKKASVVKAQLGSNNIILS